MSEVLSLPSRRRSTVLFWFLIPFLLSVPACLLLLFGRYWSREMAVQACIRADTDLLCQVALYAWSSKSVIWACLSIIVSLGILLRLRYRNPGPIFSTALFIILELILVVVLADTLWIPEPENLAQLLFGFLPIVVVPLAIESFFRMASLPEWRGTRFTLRELIAILIFIGGCFMNLISFSMGGAGAVSGALAVFFLAMSIMFARFLIDKFGTILIIAVVLSAVVAGTKPFLTYNLLSSLLPLDILAIGLLGGLAVEGALAIFTVKNVFHVFKAGRPGHVNNTFVQASGNLSKAVVFAVVAPFIFVALALKQPFASASLPTLWTGITLSLAGGVMSAFWCHDINRWGLVNLLRPTFKQIWVREFDKWVCSVAIGDIDDDGVNEVIVGCADHQIYCFRNGVLIWQTPIGNPPAASSAIGYIGARDQKKYVTGSSDGNVYCLSPSGEILWQVNTPNWVWCCTAGDADNDGEWEVVSGGMDEKLHCYKDGGKELWFAWFDSWVGCCAVGDADNDGLNEVVAGSNDNTLRCLKNGPNELWRAEFGEWVTCVAIGDVDNDGLNEVIAGSNDGTLRCFRNGVEIWRVSIPGTFNTVAIGDVDGDGLNEIAACCGDNAVRVYKNGKEVWAAGLEKYPDCVTIGDFNNDGQDEILLGDWYTWLRAFKSTRLLKEPARKEKRVELGDYVAKTQIVPETNVVETRSNDKQAKKKSKKKNRRKNAMATGACGINCDVCGLQVKQICPGCAPGTTLTVEMVAEAPCPILKCAVGKGIGHCTRDCADFPCTLMDQADYPYSAGYRGMFRQRMGVS
jgi:hypothetical protein